MDPARDTRAAPAGPQAAPGHQNLTWIRVGIGVSAAGYSLTTLYSLSQGNSLLSNQFPPSVALISLLSFAFARRRPRLAALCVLSAVWWDLTLSIYIVGGFIDPSLLVYPLMVTAAGLLLGSRSAGITAIVSVLGVSAAGFLGGATVQRLGLRHGREGFWLFTDVVCILASAVLTRAALEGYDNALERSERDRLRYRGLFEQLPEGLISLDSGDIIVDANDAAARILAADRASLVGRPVMEVLRRYGMSAAFDVKRARDHQQTLELTVNGADGVPATFELAFRPVQVPDAPTLVLLRDMTHRKLIEQHLGHAQRLEAVGQLAGGIAHDFNNLLTAIGGSAELITMQGDSEARESAEVILAAQRRGSNLTRQLLAFARRDVHQPGAIDLAGTVAGMSQIVERLLGRQHRLVPGRADPVWVEADPAQIEQVVLNLVTNACDAMPDGGNVGISVRWTSASEARKLGSRLGDPEQALLEVTDTGTGIAPELRARIFEPFFTTKERGKGTGLGLAAVQGIVAQNQGSLALETEVGVGSKFRIFFAKAQRPSASPKPPAESAAPVPARGRLLFVDDEVSVLKTAARLLRSEGYDVKTASDGAEALELLARTPNVDLVVTDLAMPGMDGRELGERIHALYPGQRVLYMSGYFNDPGLSRPGSSASAGFLAKPFSREQLLTAVKSAHEALV